MRRILVFVYMIGSVGSCVDLRKPEKVAECAAKNGCVNGPPTDGGGPREDGNANSVDIQSPNPDAANPGSDATLPSDDTGPANPGFDVGNLPDGPGVTTDGPSDLPIVTGDAPSDPPAGGGDVPALSDAPNDVPDARDGNKADVLAGACAVAGQPRPAGYPCRALAGLCDVEESCDGVSADCPPDKLAVAGTLCRAAAGDCDIEETCTGASVACPADGFKLTGTVCRAVKGPCDVAESCTGTSALCPIDSVAPATTVCRASTDGNKCDPAENCTGSSASCPADLLYAPPAAPTSPVALAGTLQATLSWTAAAGATGYNVKRSATSGSGYTTLGSSPTASASPYLDIGLSGSQTYYYVVSSIDTVATCESASSPQVTATPTGICVPPAAPVVTATPNNGTVTLTWPAVATATSYSIARSQTTGTGYATVGTVTTGSTFTDGNVVNGTTYYYVVTASNGSCSSGNSIEASASPACTPPTAIADLSAQPGNGSVVLAWTAPATAVSYQVLRSTTSGSGYILAGTKGAATGFTDTSIVNGTTYYYVVTASNGSCSSTNSNQASVTPACVPPLAPAVVTPAAGDGQVSLTWTTSLGATLYRVSRNTTGTGTFAQIATPTAASYLDQPLTDGTKYYYVVAASNGSCWSADSSAASTTPVCTPPSVPGTITATAGDAKVTLSWVASTPAPASYTLQRKTGAGGTYATIASPTVASYTDATPPLTNGTTYYYKVSASNTSCSSVYDTEVSATPVAACSQGAPGGVAATVTPSTQVKVAWTASSPVPTGGYDIGRSTTSGSGYTSVGHVGNTTLTFTDSDTSLAVGTTYYYQVTAIGTCTAASTPASIALACQTPTAPNAGLTASNAAGAITVTWTAVTGATAYTVSRSTSSGGTYTAISSNQTAATYTDPTSGLVNGTTYYYKVSASNANHQCMSAQSSATSVRSCTIPTAPAGLSAIRSGNRQVTLVWTNSPGAVSYNILRNGASVGTDTASPYQDNNAANGTAFSYVVTASSDAGGNCSSANSAQVSVPSCTVITGTGYGSAQLQAQTTEWCIVTCDNNIGWWSDANLGTRKLYINTVQQAGSGTMPLPAQQNSGYAFYFTPGAAGNGDYAYWNYGAGTGRACP
jgi:fibronectin type 3 domain-containing protein